MSFDARKFTSPGHFLLTTGAVALAVTLLAGSVVGEYTDFYLQRRLEFKTRAYLNLEPEVSPRLKVFIYDDQAAAAYGASQISPADWHYLLQAVAVKKPEAILIDKIFGYAKDGTVDEGGEGVRTLAAAVSSSGTTIGAFSSPVPIPGRADVHLYYQGPYTPSAELGNQAVALPGKLEPEAAAKASESGPAPYFYGASHQVLSAVKRLGIVNAPVNGLLPVSWTSGTGASLPQLGLTAQSATFLPRAEDLVRGKILVNLLSIPGYGKSLISLKNIIKHVRKGGDLYLINEGDTVLILPEQLTGTSEFVDSYYGMQPAGLTIAAVANSVLSRHWIGAAPFPWLFILISSLLGGALGVRLSGRLFFSSVLAVTLLLTVGGVFLFLQASTVFPWLYTSLAFGASGFLLYYQKAAVLELEGRRIRTAISSMIPANKIDAVIDYQRRHPFSAGHKDMSVMFIDIAGFSIAVAKMSTQEAFARLAAMMSKIAQVVQSHGGVVDKNLGDGMLCYFGFDFAGESARTNHADDALLAAVAIQRLVVTDILKEHAVDAKSPVLPLRIGINSGEVFIGDLGGENRIEFTIIGDAVNFAQRLESASEDFFIMLGEETTKLLSPELTEKTVLTKRLIKIKHHATLFSAYQVEPYEDCGIDIDHATQLFADFTGKHKRSERINLRVNTVLAECDYGQGFVKNVSDSGLCLILDTFLAKDVTLNFKLSDAGGFLRFRLEEFNLLPVLLQVQWGCDLGCGLYAHGMSLQQVNLEQQGRFLAIFSNAPGLVAEPGGAGSG